MTVAVVTGSAGLIGSEAARLFAARGLDVVGIDNDMRSRFFGPEASTAWMRRDLEASVRGYRHVDCDIRDQGAIERLFKELGPAIGCVVHAAAQPSHDWAAKEPMTDFSINATATLVLLEAARRHAKDAVFLFASTNKVYGDTPNRLPLVETATRFEVDPKHPFAAHGIDETMTVDGSLHSLFGVSKAAADLMVQEYGRYFGMRTACFRGGCLTGPAHSGAELHGFLAYLAKCAVTGRPYTIHGHRGKQVRDNIHARDFASALWHFFEKPRVAEVYNMGGARFANCSIIEAIRLLEELTGRPLDWRLSDNPRVGDHLWWVSDVRKFERHYPGWRLTVDLKSTLAEIVEALRARSLKSAPRPTG